MFSAEKTETKLVKNEFKVLQNCKSNKGFKSVLNLRIRINRIRNTGYRGGTDVHILTLSLLECLVEVGFPDCPVDHRKLQSCSKHEEKRQKPGNTGTFYFVQTSVAGLLNFGRLQASCIFRFLLRLLTKFTGFNFYPNYSPDCHASLLRAA